MLKRYPHMAQIKTPVLTNTGDKGIVGVSSTGLTTINIMGRFEHVSGLNRGYTGKFFLGVSQRTIELFKHDNAQFHYEGREWDIVRVIPKQTHIMIWVN